MVLFFSDDCSPQFDFPKFNLTISESKQIGSLFDVPQARDEDTPRNGIMGYRISWIEGNNFPFILQYSLKENKLLQNLVLKINNKLDRESRDQYNFILEAFDKSDHKAQLNISIKISDTNDNSPVFEQFHYNLTFPEDIPIFTKIITVKANDLDIGQNAQLSYEISLQDCNNGRKYFEIDENEGAIFIIQSLDYEIVKYCHLVISSVDHGDPIRLRSTTTIFISIKGFYFYFCFDFKLLLMQETTKRKQLSTNA